MTSTPVDINCIKDGSLARIESIARSYFVDSRGSHGWDHVVRVYRLCQKIGPLEKCDMTILLSGALLHDIGRKECDEENGARCHAKVGGVITRSILEREGFDSDSIEAITHCVASHRFRDGVSPETREAMVLYDADKLDSIGAVGIGRAFQFAGEIGARLHDPDVDPEETEAYGYDDTAYREYLVKLKHLHERILTRSGRQIALERHRFMERFFRRLNDETTGIK